MRVVTFDCGQKKEGNTALIRALIKKTLIKPTANVIKLFKASDKLPTICIFGHDDLKLFTPIQETMRRRDSTADVILLIRTSNKFSSRIGHMSL